MYVRRTIPETRYHLINNVSSIKDQHLYLEYICKYLYNQNQSVQSWFTVHLYFQRVRICMLIENVLVIMQRHYNSLIG